MLKRMAGLTARAALILSLGAVAVSAQEPAGVPPAQLPPGAQEMIAELREIAAELEPVRQRALQEPALMSEQQTLAAAIQSAMVEADASVPEQVERLQTLAGQAETAREAEDGERMVQIVAEARQIEQRLQQVQAEVVQGPEIAPRVERFQARLRAKMLELDPGTATLLERAEALDARLMAMLQPEQ